MTSARYPNPWSAFQHVPVPRPMSVPVIGVPSTFPFGNDAPGVADVPVTVQ